MDHITGSAVNAIIKKMMDDKISNTELASRLGVTEGAVRLMLHPSRCPKWETLQRAAKALGLSFCLTTSEIEG